MTGEHLETIPQMRRRHRDEFVAILKRAVQETANSSDAAMVIDMSVQQFARECDKYGVDRKNVRPGKRSVEELSK